MANEHNKLSTVIYNDGELELNISVKNETIWLTQKQIAELFSVEVHTINYHIKNLLQQKELDKNPSIRKIRIVQRKGTRDIQSISKQLGLDFQKYKLQYQNIELQEFKKAHDRFLILDQKEIYHIGASLKDLGKKWFAFSKFDIGALEVLVRLK